MPASFPRPPVDDRALYDLDFGRFARPMVAFCQELGLYERLANGALDIAAVATTFDIPSRAAEAALVMSAALGFLEVDTAGRYALSSCGRAYHFPSSPFFRPMIARDREMAENLASAFSSADPIDPHAVNIEQHAHEKIAEFINRMHSLTLPAASALGELDVFADVDHLLDVGGGSGSLSCGLAARLPDLHCTILDVEPVCRIAAGNAGDYGLEDRVDTVAADMFDGDWPGGQDAVLFGNIFHDWDPESCGHLAAHAHAALKPGGRILLHEILLNDRRDGPLIAACMSVAMLLHERGKQYSLAEFDTMLSQAGFVDCQALPAYGHYHLVVARRR